MRWRYFKTGIPSLDGIKLVNFLSVNIVVGPTILNKLPYAIIVKFQLWVFVGYIRTFYFKRVMCRPISCRYVAFGRPQGEGVSLMWTERLGQKFDFLVDVHVLKLMDNPLTVDG